MKSPGDACDVFGSAGLRGQHRVEVVRRYGDVVLEGLHAEVDILRYHGDAQSLGPYRSECRMRCRLQSLRSWRQPYSFSTASFHALSFEAAGFAIR